MWWKTPNSKLSQEDFENRHKAYYAAFFQTDAGKEVLADLMMRWGAGNVSQADPLLAAGAKLVVDYIIGCACGNDLLLQVNGMASAARKFEMMEEVKETQDLLE